MPSRERVQDFIATVESGRHVEAIEQFYAEDASMQENQAPPRRGRRNLMDGEQKVMESFEAIHTRPAEIVLIDGDRVVINWVFDFILADGRRFTFDELALQLWSGDRIIEERFYYDPGQRRPAAPAPGG